MTKLLPYSVKGSWLWWNMHVILANQKGGIFWMNNNGFYFMVLSHKDWKLPNSYIWLAEMDIGRSLDWLSSSNNIYFWKCQKADEI